MGRLSIVSAILTFLSFAASPGRAASIEEVREEAGKADPAHPWAGIYHGFGGIYLAPSGRYCAVTHYCISPFVSGDCGKIRVEGDRIATSGWRRPRSSNSHGPPYLRVAWGGRRYLVPESAILDFVNNVNAAAEPVYEGGPSASAAYLRSGDSEILVTGQPELPEKYRALLLPKPLMTTAVEIAERTNVITRIGDYEDEDCGAEARFDAGASSGVFIGMKLHAQSGDVHADVVVKEVAAASSSGRVKQFDCDKSDPLPPGTRFASRPPWRLNVSLSTEPLSTEIRFPSSKRHPPLFGGSPEDLLIDDPFPGAAAEGFSWEEVAEVTFRGPFLGALRMSDVAARMNATILELGGNVFISSGMNHSKRAEEAGGVETRDLRVFRLSYRGRPIEPGWRFSLRFAPRRRGEPNRYDWKRAALGARAAACGQFKAGAEAERAAALELLHWDEAMLARTRGLRFEDLGPERRRAAEALVPEGRRTDLVWPALHRKGSPFLAEVGSRRFAAEREFERAHPDVAAECRKLDEEARRLD